MVEYNFHDVDNTFHGLQTSWDSYLFRNKLLTMIGSYLIEITIIFGY